MTGSNIFLRRNAYFVFLWLDKILNDLNLGGGKGTAASVTILWMTNTSVIGGDTFGDSAVVPEFMGWD